MLLATILAWFGFFIIINSFDPNQGGLMVFSLFYTTLFLSIFGTLSLLGFLFRNIFNKRKALARVMALESFRQALIFSIILVVAMMMQAARVLTWWNMLLLIILASVVEFLILVFRQDDKIVKN